MEGLVESISRYLTVQIIISAPQKAVSFSVCLFIERFRATLKLKGTSAVHALRAISNDRLRSTSSGKNEPFAPREFGRLGYDTAVML